jgi:hypothetical protein
VDAPSALSLIVVAAAVGLAGYLLWRWASGALRGQDPCARCHLAGACLARGDREAARSGCQETTLVVSEMSPESAGRWLSILRSMEGVLAAEVAPGDGRLHVAYDGAKTSPQAMIAALEAAMREQPGA